MVEPTSKETRSAISGQTKGGVEQKGNAQFLGKRAQTRQDLESEAVAYVRKRMYDKGGWREAANGFRHATAPSLFGLRTSLTWRGVAALLLWFFLLAGSAILPVLARRALVQTQHHASALDAFVAIVTSLQGIDYVFMAFGVVFLGLPKAISLLRKSTKIESHKPYAELAAGIRCMPLVPDGETHHVNIQKALTHILNALKVEMSELVNDPAGSALTEAVLLQFCDPSGERMEVVARTSVSDPTHRPVSAHLLLANFVAREGRWFAENDFLSARNPFKAARVTVAGNPRIDYRSVLYLPITTARRVEDVSSQDGTSVRVEDYCMGVICVHSKRPYRFWRWGDHNKDNGGGSGNVAFERAVPYIALVSKVIEGSAARIPLEGQLP